MLQTRFSVWDEAAGSFNIPFYAPSVAAGERLFRNAVNNPESPWNKDPADYTLFELGTIELDTGFEVNHKAPINRGGALQYKITSAPVAQLPVVGAESDNPHVQEVK